MKVTINRSSPVPLHDQLVQHIALQIAAGVLKPGERLPSIRDLARRLDIHPNTVSAVYKALEGHNVVTVRQGSGVRVFEPSLPHETLSTLASRFVAAAREAAHSDGEIVRAIERALGPEPFSRLVVVDPHEDFHPLYLHELGRWLTCPIETTTMEALAVANAAELEGAAFATSMYHLSATQDAIGPDRRLLVFQVSTGEDLLTAVRAIPKGHTMALVSLSETMMHMAHEIVAGLRGDELLLLEAPTHDAERLRSALRLADVIATDSPSAATVQALTLRPLLTLQLLPPASLRALAAQLPASALRPEALAWLD